jgi:hypothetical protein
VLEPTSILVNRRVRRAKTDRLDAEGMLRVLAAWQGGDRQVCSMVRVPTPEEEDAKRPHREREQLVREKQRIENRIEALLFTQGIRGRPSLRSWERDMAELRTGDGRAVPPLKGSLSYVWAPVGSRPPMVRDNRHDTAYIFGAICPARGIGAAIVTPTVNTECMSLHLEEISTQVAPGAVAAVICDGAGWHATGGELKVPDNIVLLPLPPYAPELNPMENVWEYLRANQLSANVWNDYDAILNACAEAWNWLIAEPDRIRTIGTREWATVSV